MRLPLASGSRLRPLAGMPCAGLTEPLDQRIESFLADILALAGEDLDAIARWVRVALADCEEIFRAQETNRLFRDDGDPYRVSRGVTPAGGVMKRKTDDATSARATTGRPPFCTATCPVAGPIREFSNGCWWMIVPMEAGEITMAMTAANGCARFGSADAGVRFR